VLRYVIKRILWLIPVIIAVSFIVYSLLELAPGTIVDAMINSNMTQADIDALRSEYNLDRSMFYRYALYMFNLIRGDLGVSDVTKMRVWDMYITRLPHTLVLSFAALVIGTVFAVPLGIFAAKRAGKLADNITTTFTLIGMSMPAFWVGLLLLLLFALQLQWLPAGDNRHGLRSLILPAVCSALILMATTTRQTRSSMLEVLNADFLRTARAKGVPEKAVIRRHALGNAWIPILTTLGTALSVQLAGAVVVESVFTWPGVGRMAAEAVLARDVTATLGCVIMTTILYVLVQLIVDLMYAFIDPRIKAQYTTKKRKKRAAIALAGRAGGDSYGTSAPDPVVPDSAEPDTGVTVMTADIDEGGSLLTGTDHIEDASEQDAPAPDIYAAAVKDEYVVATAVPAEVSSVISAAETEDGNEKASAAETKQASGLSGKETPDGGAPEFKSIMRQYKKRSQMGDIFYRIRKNKGAMVGLLIFGALLLLLIGSFFISWESITYGNARLRFTPPNMQFPFGTDDNGRNSLLRVIYGTRYSLVIGFGAVAIAAFFGVLLGSIAGYYGRLTEDIIMRVSDVIASIPGILLGMVIVTVLGHSLRNLIIAVGVTAIPVFIRITRASILTLRNQEFVEAARAIGLSNVRIIFTQVLTNGLSPVIVMVTASLGISIIIAASLSFLGFGVPVPHPEWGALISAGRDFARVAPWLMFFPGLFIMITVLAFNLLGDGLRDALDPKLKK